MIVGLHDFKFLLNVWDQNYTDYWFILHMTQYSIAGRKTIAILILKGAKTPINSVNSALVEQAMNI